MGFLVVVLGLPESLLSVVVWPVSNESGVFSLVLLSPLLLLRVFRLAILLGHECCGGKPSQLQSS